MIESVSTFTAREGEMKTFEASLEKTNLKNGQVVLYDKGADSKFNHDLLKEKGLNSGIMKCKTKGKPLSKNNKKRNKLIGKKRFVVERTFGSMKQHYGLHRAKYLGIAKTHGQTMLCSIAYNCRRSVNIFIKNKQIQDSYA